MSGSSHYRRHVSSLLITLVQLGPKIQALNVIYHVYGSSGVGSCCCSKEIFTVFPPSLAFPKRVFRVSVIVAVSAASGVSGEDEPDCVSMCDWSFDEVWTGKDRAATVGS